MTLHEAFKSSKNGTQKKSFKDKIKHYQFIFTRTIKIKSFQIISITTCVVLVMGIFSLLSYIFNESVQSILFFIVFTIETNISTIYIFPYSIGIKGMEIK